jgi:hypothetical protein
MFVWASPSNDEQSFFIGLSFDFTLRNQIPLRLRDLERSGRDKKMFLAESQRTQREPMFVWASPKKEQSVCKGLYLIFLSEIKFLGVSVSLSAAGEKQKNNSIQKTACVFSKFTL